MHHVFKGRSGSTRSTKASGASPRSTSRSIDLRMAKAETDRMAVKKKVKICLGLPWYDGADKDCIANMLSFQHYLGRLQERMQWLTESDYGGIEKLDPLGNGEAEVPLSLIGTEFEFGIAEEIGLSLPGMARERIVDYALKWEADYVLFYDDDMLFTNDLFLRLYSAQKQVVAALAFTARKPLSPVIYKFYNRQDEDRKECPRCRRMVPFAETACPEDGEKLVLRELIDITPVMNYKRDALQKVDAVGSGVILIRTDVFKILPKPWFHSPGIGEDIFFSYQCGRHGIDVWVDTSVKTVHKPRYETQWHSEELFEKQMQELASAAK